MSEDDVTQKLIDEELLNTWTRPETQHVIQIGSGSGWGSQRGAFLPLQYFKCKLRAAVEKVANRITLDFKHNFNGNEFIIVNGVKCVGVSATELDDGYTATFAVPDASPDLLIADEIEIRIPWACEGVRGGNGGILGETFEDEEGNAITYQGANFYPLAIFRNETTTKYTGIQSKILQLRAVNSYGQLEEFTPLLSENCATWTMNLINGNNGYGFRAEFDKKALSPNSEPVLIGATVEVFQSTNLNYDSMAETENILGGIQYFYQMEQQKEVIIRRIR